jgi:hypothetical protein
MEDSTLNDVWDSLGGIGDVVHELPPLSTSEDKSGGKAADEIRRPSLATKIIKLTVKMGFVVHNFLPSTVAIDFRDSPLACFD